MRQISSIASLLALAVAANACGGGGGGEGGKPRQAAALPFAPARITVTSPAFAPNATLPRRFTCQGEGAAPPLSWSSVPAGTRELALVVEDPDARSGSFVHWIVLGIPPASRGLAAKPATLRLGRASSGRVGYEPPCPPKGDGAHRYVFALYALRRPVGLPLGAAVNPVRAAIARSAFARGTLIGRFARPR